MQIGSSPLSPAILNLTQSKGSPTEQDKKDAPILRLPPELIREICNYTVTPYTREQSIQQLATFMRVHSTFLAEGNYVLKPDTAIQAEWTEGKRGWCQKKFWDITHSSHSTPEQVKKDVENLLNEEQHIGFYLSEKIVSPENRSIVLNVLLNKQDIKSLLLDFGLHRESSNNPQALIEQLVTILTNNPALYEIDLNLRGNQLNADHMETLGKALSGRSILDLNLYKNFLGNEGVKRLANHFQPQPSSKTVIGRLILAANEISDESVPYPNRSF